MQYSKIFKEAEDLKKRIRRDFNRYDETFRVGVEIEACLLDNKAIPVNAAPLIRELEDTEHKIDFEYGICQFEYKTQPTPMDRLLDLNILIEGFIEDLERQLLKFTKKSKFFLFSWVVILPQKF